MEFSLLDQLADQIERAANTSIEQKRRLSVEQAIRTKRVLITHLRGKMDEYLQKQVEALSDIHRIEAEIAEALKGLEG